MDEGVSGTFGEMTQREKSAPAVKGDGRTSMTLTF